MAAEVDRLMTKNTGIDPNLSENHIRCFCHKIALILNAGIKAIQLSSNGLVPSQGQVLGLVPGLAPILEESEEIEDAPQFTVEDVILGVENNNQVETENNNDEVINDMDSEDPDSWEETREGKNRVDKILKKVNSWLRFQI
ncbi:hypothetical protein PTTG_06600 [Puccinia triticina 1-1 BBBD Race 1]|uniref:HAT C-terminal dimerisation domain-containing protein n=1 Tax=Puccinia triticina (isolate 1-1 / race 1 (BBBD)) TaxID=630390 RepID=A0A0C4F0I3_PUCT1|nr:hypothetical protein PTTG_06600 [Puccinia triticina 1-1 BBBD Race 1]